MSRIPGTMVHATPAATALGAVVHDVDLRDTHAAALWRELHDLIAHRHLLVFPGQQLDDEQHLAVASQFGRIAAEGLVEKRRVGYVSNHRSDGVLGADAASFHIDYGFFAEPYEYLSLYGLEIPATGSETHYVNGVLAARTLPASLRAKVVGLLARQVLDLSSATGQYDVRSRRGRVPSPLAQMTRPVLWPHRDSGAEILGVWQQQTDWLDPLGNEESASLLEDLYDHLYQPRHTYVHHWAEGDLVLWDNHAVQHGRPAVGRTKPRTLRRVCVGSDQDLSVFLREKTTTDDRSSMTIQEQDSHAEGDSAQR